MGFKGKKFLVTGAARGIGLAIAREIAAKGGELYLVDRLKDELDGAVAEFIRNGDSAFAFYADLSDKKSIDDMLAEVEKKSNGAIYGLVNNAGITRDTLLIRMSDEDWQTVLDINLTSAFRITRAVSKWMMKAREGRIVNISSVVAEMGNPGQANYCASKAGLLGFTKSIAREFAPRGITVNAVAPGFIDTPMTQALDEKARTRLTEMIPLGRLGKPEDIAVAVSFLLSDEASYITGQVLHIGGGIYI